MFEFKPILSTLWHHKVSALLIALQLALTLVIVSNTLLIVTDRIEKMARPTGMDVENILTVNFLAIPQDYDMAGAVRADLDMLRTLPSVVDATPSHQIPLSGSGSANAYHTQPNQKTGGAIANYYRTDLHFIKSLGLALVAGRNFTQTDMQVFAPNEQRQAPVIIVTRQLAETLFPGEDALGKPLYNGNSPMEIIGIVERHLGAWPDWSSAGNVVFFPALRTTQSMNYLVRTESGERDRVFKLLADKLAERDPERVIKVNTLSNRMARSYAGDNMMVKVLSTVGAMLGFIVALGIVGLTSFWINQRTKQIGVRRALGATRTNISRYFLLENSLIAATGIALGAAAALIANQYLVRDYSQPVLTLLPLAVCALVILLVSLCAALAPALRAANISPATATRSV
ncbi:FtsX-like permease family protein [Microbulbifer sp. 2205BS26-8]|uniref:FtsX-like permease family protein n=1 Tax=Microbulbifer sp. 2205BS26-8 TaxID=3064386 RepID=UPI00273DC8F0|nr:FtsX-like permease family protein [Microbulbifer sp. 2205BS26-8]MDP5209240.1 ABC transporter permease [Microbulbifer sp. 2205BS26-8]